MTVLVIGVFALVATLGILAAAIDRKAAAQQRLAQATEAVARGQRRRMPDAPPHDHGGITTSIRVWGCGCVHTWDGRARARRLTSCGLPDDPNGACSLCKPGTPCPAHEAERTAEQ